MVSSILNAVRRNAIRKAVAFGIAALVILGVSKLWLLLSDRRLLIPHVTTRDG